MVMFFDKAIEDIKNGAEEVMTHGNTVSKDNMSLLIDAVNNTHTLKSFIFDPNEIEDIIQASALFQALGQHKSLEKLEVALNQSLTDKNLDALCDLVSGHPNIKDFSVAKYTCSDEGLQHLVHRIASNKQLTTFQCYLHNTSDDATMEALTTLVAQSGIKNLYFYPKYVTREHIDRLTAVLKTNTTLKHLCMSVRDSGPLALQPLLNYIKTNTTIQKLALGSINDTQTMEKLVEIMTSNRFLTSLVINIAPVFENLELAYQLIENNNTLRSFEFHGPGHSIHDTPEWEVLANKIQDKVKQNRKLLDSQKTVECNKKTTNNKRPASVLQSQTSVTTLPNKRIRIAEEPETDSKENNNQRPPPIVT